VPEARTAQRPERPPTPEWLVRGEPAMCPCGCSGRRKKGSFVEKTLNGGAALIRQVMFGEDVAAQAGLLQRLDPRAKVVGLVVLLVSASLLHNIASLVAMYLLTLVVAAASRLPLGFFVKRVWLFIPLFTLVVVLPATLSIVTEGKVVLELWTWHGHPEGLTEQGLTSAALVVLRVAVSISLVVLLTLTTPWVKLLAALFWAASTVVASELPVQAALAVLLLAIFACARLGPGLLWRGLRGALWLLGFVASPRARARSVRLSLWPIPSW